MINIMYLRRREREKLQHHIRILPRFDLGPQHHIRILPRFDLGPQPHIRILPRFGLVNPNGLGPAGS